MGEHLVNPVAQANAVPQRQVKVVDIAEGYGIIGLSLEPVVSLDSGTETVNFCAILSIVGGRMSDLVPMIPTKLVLGELVSLPVADVRAKLEAALKQQEPPQ